MSVVEKDYLPQYAAEAVRDLEYVAKNIVKAYGDTEGFRAVEHTNRQVANLIREAVHMVIPENGEIYRSVREFSTEEEAISSVGIPAPVVTIEYALPHNGKQSEVQYHDDVQTFGYRSKFYSNPTASILVVMDMKQFPGLFEESVEPIENTPVSLLILSKFTTSPHNKFPDIKWTVSQYGMNILAPVRMERFINANGQEDCWIKSSIYNIYKDHMTDAEAEKELPDEFRRQIRSGYYEHINAFLQTCHSLRVGATLEARKEKSYTRSRTFEKKGVGGFEYHVLKLPTGTVRETLGSRVGSDRDGPKYHFRRAHLRTLSKGTQTFVRSCFVGNREKGTVEKEYKIPKEQA